MRFRRWSLHQSLTSLIIHPKFIDILIFLTMRLVVLTSYLHVSCYLIFSMPSRHTLAMSHQSHRYGVVDLGGGRHFRCGRPNSGPSLLMSCFFVSDGVILSRAVSLVGQVCEVLLIVLAFQPSCAEEWVPYQFVPQRPTFFAHPRLKNITCLPFGSLEASAPERCSRPVCSRRGLCQEGCDTMTKMSRTEWVVSVLQVWTRGHETMDAE